MNTPHRRVPVGLGDRAYEVVIGPEVLGAAGRYHRELGLGPALIVTEPEVAAPHAPALVDSLRDAGVSVRAVIEVPSGEPAKSYASFEQLVERLLAAEIRRDCSVYAVGGGCVGDLAGFAAGTVLRGVSFVQAPTTLLAQVDSSVGGKTAINTRAGKNLLGVFHQPRLVLADIATLRTLPLRELRAGYGEVVKYGLLGDADLFAWLERHGPALLAGDEELRTAAVERCCRIKAQVIVDDEREQGGRALLNLGHTFGHALEAEAGMDGTLRHGEAVAVGCVLAFRFSERHGHVPAGTADRVARHFAQVGLPTSPREALGRPWPAETALQQMHSDKKIRSDNRLPLVLARAIGAAFLARDCSRDELARFLCAEAAT